MRFDRPIKYRSALAGAILLAAGALPGAQAGERLPPVTSHSTEVRYAVRRASAESMPEPFVPGHADASRPSENITTPPLQLCPEAFASGQTVQDDGEYPIDLPTALMLADRANPEIGIARQGILASEAVQTLARSILVPNLNAGANLHIHNGPLQRSSGQILTLAEKSLYVGGGAGTLAAETVKVPMVQISAALTDAIFEPLAARQRLAASRFHTSSTFNTILRDVSTGYIELMAAEARLAILQESYVNATEVAHTTSNFAEVGEARQADADRTQTEAALINSEVQLAIADRAVASAELCRLLNLDPSLRLTTVQGRPIPVLELVDKSYSVEQLIGVAMRLRPDLAARNAEVAEMEAHYRQERVRPWLPTIMVGFSAGTLGGGSNLQQAAVQRPTNLSAPSEPVPISTPSPIGRRKTLDSATWRCGASGGHSAIRISTSGSRR